MGYSVNIVRNSNSKLKVGTLLTSAVALLVAFGVPANSEGPVEPVPLTFDSVGSLLQDMDRESDTPQQGMTECEAEALNQRLKDSYVRLQERATELREENAAVSDRMAVKRAHVAVKRAAKQSRVSMKKLKQQSEEIDVAEQMTVAETAAAALRAAEAALENAH